MNELHWAVYLAGALAVAVVVMAVRAARAGRELARREAELARVREELKQEKLSCQRLGKELEASRAKELETSLASPAVPEPERPSPTTVDQGQLEYADSLADQLTGWTNVGDRLTAAFSNNEFRLYAQAIASLTVARGPAMYEILVRLKEEEDNLMPPGAFLPLIERHGMLPQLDRWVTTHVLEWISGDASRASGVYSVNVSGATIIDPGFATFVVGALRTYQQPGRTLCFEFTEAMAAEKEGAVTRFVNAMRAAGCRTALSGFGRSEVSFRLLKSFKPDYIKIDGNIVLQMLRDRVAHAKVKAITQVSSTLGAATIAELVEDEETIVALKTAGVQYAQGFGIARPRPIEEISAAEVR